MDKETFMKTLGYEIYKRRMARGWTQKVLADFAQISTASINQYESRTSIPSALALCNIADALECTVHDLLGRSN